MDYNKLTDKQKIKLLERDIHKLSLEISGKAFASGKIHKPILSPVNKTINARFYYLLTDNKHRPSIPFIPCATAEELFFDLNE